MATGYIVSGRGDLDVLFKARTSAAAAAVGFLSNGGVDLSQRFEPRAGSPAIANTNFKAGANDLASLFMDINYASFTPILTLTMTAGEDAGSGDRGYRNTASGYSAYAGQAISGTPEWTKTANLFRLEQITYNFAMGDEYQFRCSHASTAPANADTTWTAVALTGVFTNSGGVSVRRVMTRASNYVSTASATTPSGRPQRQWQFNPGAQFRFIIGNSYTIEIG